MTSKRQSRHQARQRQARIADIAASVAGIVGGMAILASPFILTYANQTQSGAAMVAAMGCITLAAIGCFWVAVKAFE